MRELQIPAVHRVSGRRGRVHLAGYPSGVGIYDETAKLVIVRILRLDGCMAAQAVLILRVGGQPRLDVGHRMAC